TGHGANQLPLIGIPLEMEAPDRPGPREALVHLAEVDPAQEIQALEVALAVVLREVTPIVPETSKADHRDLGEYQPVHVHDLHQVVSPAHRGSSSCPPRHGFTTNRADCQVGTATAGGTPGPGRTRLSTMQEPGQDPQVDVRHLLLIQE